MTDDPALLDGRATADDVVRVLCEAFVDYPVMRYVLGEFGDYRRQPDAGPPPPQ